PRENVYATLTWTHFGDHVAHMNVARVFPRIGLDMWRKPMTSLFPPLVDRSRLPPELADWRSAMFVVPGCPDEKPLTLSWEKAPRNYPPGLTLLVAPVAFLYHTTSLGLGTAARLLIALFLVGAHLGLYGFFVAGTAGRERALGWLTIAIAYVT